MDAGLNGPALQVFRRYIPEKKWLAVLDLHPEHLVEIAIVDLPLPSDADGAAAHQALDRYGVETVGQQFQVSVPLALLAEVLGKPGDGLVGDRKEARELDAIAAAQFNFVISL